MTTYTVEEMIKKYEQEIQDCLDTIECYEKSVLHHQSYIEGYRKKIRDITKLINKLEAIKND